MTQLLPVAQAPPQLYLQLLAARLDADALRSGRYTSFQAAIE